MLASRIRVSSSCSVTLRQPRPTAAGEVASEVPVTGRHSSLPTLLNLNAGGPICHRSASCRNRADSEQAIFLSFHGRIISKVFIALFLARGVLIVARRCSSARRRRAAFTSMVDSDPRPARPGPPDATNYFARTVSWPPASTHMWTIVDLEYAIVDATRHVSLEMK